MTNTTYSTEIWWQRRTPANLLVGLAYAAMLCVLYGAIGHIPVDNGAGWDGRVYLQYLEMLGHGQTIIDDPYRTIRLSGFLPLIGASALGASIDAMVQIQITLNIILLSASAALLHDTLRQLGSTPRTALLSMSTGLLAWPFLIIPFFYPVISDNIALMISCLSLWSWARRHQIVVYFLLAYSVWVMPGLFLIPLVLAAMPIASDRTSTGLTQKRLPYALFAISLPVILSLLIHMLGTLTDADIAAHSAHLEGQTALVSLRPLSTLALGASITLALWLGAKAVSDGSVWKSLSPNAAIKAALVLGASALAMYLLIDWDRGFKGPPLLNFMLMQSLAAPFKPLVAHFLTFGPIILMALAGCIAWSRGRAPLLPKALLVCLLGFLPLLLVGSESRQWIGILPVAVVIAAQTSFSFGQRLCGVIFAVALALPSLWLKDSTYTALSNGMSFQSAPWQYYFGRQGPWMSVETYEFGIILLGLYTLLMVAAHFHDKRTKATAAE